MLTLSNSSIRSETSQSAPEPALGRYFWQPSNVCVGALWALALLAPLSVLASDFSAWTAWPMALLACRFGIRSARAYAALPEHELTLPHSGGPPLCDGLPITDLRLRWRGPLAFVDWKPVAAVRRRRLVFWPDVLDAATRRELRLAAQRLDAVSKTASVAG